MSIKPSVTLIAASAGSGKTFRLTQKYIELLLKGNDISTLLAITFTENAAKQMKDKIIRSLKELYLGVGDANKMLELSKVDVKVIDVILEKIFKRYNQFNVKTIDSFITSIFSLSSFEFNYPADFSVNFNYKNIVYDEVFKFFSKKILNKQTNEIDGFLDLMNRIEANSLFDPTEKIVDYFSEFFKKEDDFLANIKQYSKKEKDRLVSKLMIMGSTILSEIKKITNKYSPNVFYKDILTSLETQDPELASKTIILKETLFKEKELQGIFKDKELLKLSKEYLSLRARLFYLPYFELYCQFRKEFKESQRKSRNVVLSSMARDIYLMLRQKDNILIDDIYIKLSSVFNHFLIDEFQDTSYSQWVIIKPFIEEALSRGGTSFLIGDMKQAIYMFRNADYRIMKDMIENPRSTIYLDTSTLENGIDIVNIGVNYRSSQIILNYVNNFFNSPSFDEYLINENIYSFKNIYNIRHQAAEKKDGYVKTIKVKEEDIKYFFLDIVNDAIKRMPLSSIAVLSYRNDMLDEISIWLGEEGIPVVSYGELDIRKNRTVNSIINFLRFLNKPNDDFNFSIFILSPLFIKRLESIVNRQDIEDSFMMAYKKNISKINIFKKRFKNIWNEMLQPLIDETSKRDVYSLISLILTRFNVTENFPKDSAYILKLLDLVSELIKEESIYSLSDLIDFIDSSDEDDEKFSAEISPTANAIKLLTFHKAKGLEFDTVINVFAQSQRGGPKIYYDVDGEEITVYGLNKEISQANENLKRIYLSNNIDDKIADINTVYVALTRAKNELYNIVLDIPRKPTILELFSNFEDGKKTEIKKTKENTYEFVANIKKTGDIINTVKLDLLNEQTIEGKIFHKAISLHFSNNIDLEESLEVAINYEDVVVDKSVRKKIFKLIKKTINDKRLKDIIRKESIIKSELEFSDEQLNIMRADLVVINENEIYVVDFKTGSFNEDDERQIKKYISCIGKIYNSKNIIGIIYYVTTGKMLVYKKKEEFKEQFLWKEF